MSEPIYFKIVEFQRRIGYGNIHSVIHLDLNLGELTYQVFDWKRNMPAVSGIKAFDFDGKTEYLDVNYPAKIIKSAKTDFKPTAIAEDFYEKEIVYNCGVKLDRSQKSALLKLCNALDFEPYRDREMSMHDPGFIGYRDCVSVNFIGITDSYIPKMEWSMPYLYDEEHTWPSEKLYRYLFKKFLKKFESADDLVLYF